MDRVHVQRTNHLHGVQGKGTAFTPVQTSTRSRSCSHEGRKLELPRDRAVNKLHRGHGSIGAIAFLPKAKSCVPRQGHSFSG